MVIFRSQRIITLSLAALACCLMAAGSVGADMLAQTGLSPSSETSRDLDSRLFDWSFAPRVEFSSGDTRYLSDQVVVASELIFPLDFKLVGAGVEARWWRNDSPDWTLSASIVTSINNPSGVFTDRDWLIFGDGSTFDFSYSESRVEASMTRFEFGVEKFVATNGQAELSVLVRLEYQKIKQEAIDLDLWQRVYSESDEAWVEGTWYGVVHALSYEVTSWTPKLGLSSRFHIAPALTANLITVVTPLAQVKDYDHHRLRNFEVRADGRGFGWQVQGGLKYEAPKAEGKSAVFVQLDGRYSRLEADPSAVAVFYADDPSPEDDFHAGDIIPFIPHKITTSLFWIGLQVGLRY